MSSEIPDSFDLSAITVIELDMMDKSKYFPLTLLSGFTIRTILYPFTLVKTRLQLQRQNTIYTSLYDAFRKTVSGEGFRGLYRGFWVSNLMAVSQITYVGTYEAVRHTMARNGFSSDRKLKSFVAGGCASVVGQTTVVPIDIVSQHLQMLGGIRSDIEKGINTKASDNEVRQRLRGGLPLNLPPGALNSRFGAAHAIVTAIYLRDGFSGFYRGYIASLVTYAPSSAMWWFFYDSYCETLSDVSPVWVPRLALQCIAAPLGGISATIITTPMDVIRARIQLEHTKFLETAQTLWQEERMGIFVKGLSARIVSSVAFSFFIILGYETIKRWSLLDEYKGTDSVGDRPDWEPNPWPPVVYVHSGHHP